MKTQKRHSSYLKNLLCDFVSELGLSKSKATVYAYEHDLNNFISWLEERHIKTAKGLKQGNIIGYLGHSKQIGKSEASVNRYFMSIRAFCNYLRKTKVLPEDVSIDIKAPRIDQKAPRVPTKAEMEKLLEQPDIETHSGVRDRAILELMYSSGLRASELCDLEIQHVSDGGIVVSCGKRGKTRAVPATSEALTWIKCYIQGYRGEGQGWLFKTVLGKKIRRQLLHEIVVGYAAKARVHEVTPHTLRHACATHLLDQGADLRLIQDVLGHSSIASTQRYTHLSSNRMRQMFNEFHPRKKSS